MINRVLISLWMLMSFTAVHYYCKRALYNVFQGVLKSKLNQNITFSLILIVLLCTIYQCMLFHREIARQNTICVVSIL